jgi:four helix bundle protein
MVYQKAMRFAALRGALLGRLPRRVAASDHLKRAAESILVNIAHASSAWSASERIVCLGHANGSALECAACLDVFVAKMLMSTDEAHPGKSLLAEVVRMLVAMRKTTANRVCDKQEVYLTKKGRLFDYEDLDVYQAALQLVGWPESMWNVFACSADLRTKLDKSTTSIVLNIAEGNGRFTSKEQVSFYATAYRATTQSASIIDLATEHGGAEASHMEAGRNWLRRIAAMLTALAKAVSQAPLHHHT